MRIANRILMAVLALALIALGVITAVETVLAMLGRTGQVVSRAAVDSSLEAADWSDPVVIAIAAGLVVLGLVLVAFQVKPRRPQSYPSHRGDERRTFTVDRHGLETLAEQVTRSDPDCEGGRAKLKRRRLRVTAEIFADRDSAEVESRVADRIRARLAQLELERTPRVRVTSATADRRTR